MTSTKNSPVSSHSSPSSSSSKENGRRRLRIVVGVLVLIIFSRQGLLGFKASMRIKISDGMVTIENVIDNSEVECDDNDNNSDIDIASPTPLEVRDLSASTITKDQNVKTTSSRTPKIKTLRIVAPSLQQQEEEVQPYNPPDNATVSTCTGYRFFPIPEHHSGLPYLADVFATRDRTELFFIGNNRGICSGEFVTQDNWMDGNKRFMCSFPNNTMVISEFVAPTGRFFKNNFMFKCKIPKEFRHLVVPGQLDTKLHVDLHSIHDPEVTPFSMKDDKRKNIQPFPSQKVTDTPKIDGIPVCHAGYADLGDHQYQLVAYTRVQSTYKTQVDKNGNTKIRSTIHRLQEWIDWHVTQGFDHFIIYDNDPEPHGPIEQLTKSYVDSGLVTYRWFPMKDCRIDSGKKKGNIKRFGQAAGGLSAMHRLTSKGAKYMAHMDVDEFFIIYKDDVTVLDYVKKVPGLGTYVDCIAFRPTVLDHCDGYQVHSEMDSTLQSKQCMTRGAGSHASDYKLIMSMERMYHFQVHYPLANKDWQSPRQYKVPDNEKASPGRAGDGFLAHFRGEVAPGIKKTKWKDRVHYFDKFLAERNLKLGTVQPPPLANTTLNTSTTTTTVAVDDSSEAQVEQAANNGANQSDTAILATSTSTTTFDDPEAVAKNENNMIKKQQEKLHKARQQRERLQVEQKDAMLFGGGSGSGFANATFHAAATSTTTDTIQPTHTSSGSSSIGSNSTTTIHATLATSTSTNNVTTPSTQVINPDRTWRPSKEWLRSCVAELEQNKTGLLKPFFSWRNRYGLGDCIKMCARCTVGKKNNKDQNLAVQYSKRACDINHPYYVSGGNLTIVESLLKLFAVKQKHPPLPSPDAIVIHLRVGDIIEKSKQSTTQLLLKGGDPFHTTEFKSSIKSVYEFMDNIDQSNATQVVIIGGTFKRHQFEKSRVYAGCLERAIQQAGYNVSMDLDAPDADYDFYYMTHAKRLIVSAGGYSALIAKLVIRNGGQVIGRTFDDPKAVANYERKKLKRLQQQQ